LFPLEDNIKPKDLFVFPFLNRMDIKYYNKLYTTRLITPDLKDRYLMGYLLKSTDTHLIQLDRELFREQDVQNWEKLFFIIDTEQQLILFEYSTNIATPNNIKNVLVHLTKKTASASGYEVKIDFLVDKYAFWNIIKESNGLFQIAFDLNAPNLFGGSKKANEWLKALKEKHNMTNVKIDFRNDNADLKYDEEELDSYRDYADSGGGNWTLGVIHNGRKKRYFSEDHLRKKEVDFTADDPGFIRQNIIYIKERLILIIKNINENEE